MRILLYSGIYEINIQYCLVLSRFTKRSAIPVAHREYKAIMWHVERMGEEEKCTLCCGGDIWVKQTTWKI